MIETVLSKRRRELKERLRHEAIKRLELAVSSYRIHFSILNKDINTFKRFLKSKAIKDQNGVDPL